ncbi:MAG: hypothetical protein F6J96_33655 [Symploca sp. SIO1C2]|nr:hypothetical protein [Symploca sp. SIO1C2]
MNTTAIELVIFKTKPNVSPEILKEAIHKTTPVLAQIDGFLDRELSLTETGEEWVDIVHWKNMELAKKAVDIFMNTPECQELVSLMQESYSMRHLNSMLYAKKNQ